MLRPTALLAVTLLIASAASVDGQAPTAMWRAAWGFGGGDNGTYGVSPFAQLMEAGVGRRLTPRTAVMLHAVDLRGRPPGTIVCGSFCVRHEYVSVTGLAAGHEFTLPNDRWIVAVRLGWHAGAYVTHHNTLSRFKPPTLLWPGAGISAEVPIRLWRVTFGPRANLFNLVRPGVRPMEIGMGAFVLTYRSD